jgi:hypothetical protein
MKSYSTKKIKRLIKTYAFTLWILLIIPTTNHAKSASKLRKLLNHLHFNFSTGYGITSYQNQVFKYAVFVREGNYYLYNPYEGAQTGYLVRWFGKPYVRTHLHESESFLKGLRKIVDGKGETITFYGVGHTFPITLSGHMDFKKKWRVEIGGGIYMHMVDQLVPAARYRGLGTYNVPEGNHYTTKFFAITGHKLLENADYSLLLNTQLSYDFVYGNPFKDASAANSNFLSPAVGIGLTLEKHISEYLSMFWKVMYENVNLADIMNKQHSSTILYARENLLFQIGVTFSCAEIPKCPIDGCEIEVKHKHADIAYRGVSISTGENSMGYKLYKK